MLITVAPEPLIAGPIEGITLRIACPLAAEPELELDPELDMIFVPLLIVGLIVVVEILEGRGGRVCDEEKEEDEVLAGT